MPDIKHAITIDAPAAAVEPLVKTPESLAAWWAEDVAAVDRSPRGDT